MAFGSPPFTGFRCNDRAFDVSGVRPIVIPAMKNLWCMLNLALFAESDLWRSLDIPGSPFALALDREGTVLAKGTFNNLAQLESVLATAERRGQTAGA